MVRCSVTYQLLKMSVNSVSVCSDVDLTKIATYEQVKDLPNHPEKLLIDVREPHELVETGVIPTSINIPRKSTQKCCSWAISSNLFLYNESETSSWDANGIERRI